MATALCAVLVGVIRRSAFGRRLVALSDSPAAFATVGLSSVADQGVRLRPLRRHGRVRRRALRRATGGHRFQRRPVLRQPDPAAFRGHLGHPDPDRRAPGGHDGGGAPRPADSTSRRPWPISPALSAGIGIVLLAQQPRRHSRLDLAGEPLAPAVLRPRRMSQPSLLRRIRTWPMPPDAARRWTALDVDHVERPLRWGRRPLRRLAAGVGRRGHRTDRPERRRQDHAVQRHHRAAAARPGAPSPGTASDVTRKGTHRRARLGLARTFQRLELFWLADARPTTCGSASSLRRRRTRPAARPSSSGSGSGTRPRPASARSPPVRPGWSSWPAPWPTDPRCCCSMSPARASMSTRPPPSASSSRRWRRRAAPSSWSSTTPSWFCGSARPCTCLTSVRSSPRARPKRFDGTRRAAGLSRPGAAHDEPAEPADGSQSADEAGS